MSYIGRTPIVGNFVKLDAITTSATATFNLLNGGVAYYPQSANNCIVSLNGVIQSPTSAYTISGSTIVFSDALTASDSIDFILVLGDVLSIGTPSDGTVGFAKVTSNLITGATAETTIAGGDSILIYDDSASALRKMTRTNFVSGVGGTNTPAFLAYLNSGQSITANTYVKVQIGTEVYDTDNCYDPTTNYRFTPTTAGKYFVYGAIRHDWDSNWGDQQFTRIYKNGNVVATWDNFQNGTAAGQYGTAYIATTVDMNGSTDYLELYGRSNASSPTFLAGSSYTYFGAYKLIGV